MTNPPKRTSRKAPGHPPEAPREEAILVGAPAAPTPEVAAGVGQTRRSRSREATRQKLISATLRVVARKGLDGAAIADITEEADVGFGSFYNHFATKGEITTVVFEARANEVAEVNDLIGMRVTDTATAIAYIQRFLLTKAVHDPIWGWFVVHAANGMPEMSRLFMMRGKRDIERGVEQGRFSVASVDTAMRIILSALLDTMRIVLECNATGNVVSETIECLLRMLGVPAAEARTLSRKKLPAFVMHHFKP